MAASFLYNRQSLTNRTPNSLITSSATYTILSRYSFRLNFLLFATSCNQYLCRRFKDFELPQLGLVLQWFTVDYSLGGTVVLSIYSQLMRPYFDLEIFSKFKPLPDNGVYA